MKKLFNLFLLSVILAGCSDNITENGPQISYEQESLLRTKQEAVDLAKAVMTNSTSRSTSEVANVSVICSNEARGYQDTLMYVVNFENNDGFVIVSAPQTVDPLLGFSFSGNCTTGTKRNENFEFFLQYAKAYVKEKSILSRSANPPEDHSFIVKFQHRNGPRVPLEGGQYWPENKYFDNRATGCGNLALAELCFYFQSPASLQLTFPGKDKDAVNFNWSEMLKHKRSVNSLEQTFPLVATHMDTCGANYEAHCDLGRLCRQIAVYTNSSFIDDEFHFTAATGVTYDGMINGFTTLFPNKQHSGRTPTSSLFNDLDTDGNVAIMFGESNSSDKVSHIWLTDGNYIASITVNIVKNGVTYPGVASVYKYINHNWGYNGENNGFFLDGIFNPEHSTNIHPGPDPKPTFPSRSDEKSIYDNVFYVLVKK